MATQSLLMVAATAAAAVVAGILGTFLQLVVFDFEEQELLPEAGVWGYVAGFFLLALMVLPAVVGMVLGVRARRLGEHRLGTSGTRRERSRRDVSRGHVRPPPSCSADALLSAPPVPWPARVGQRSGIPRPPLVVLQGQRRVVIVGPVG